MTVEKKDLDWGSLDFGYHKTDYPTFAAKEGRSPTLSWENGPLSCDFFRRGTP